MKLLQSTEIYEIATLAGLREIVQISKDFGLTQIRDCQLINEGATFQVLIREQRREVILLTLTPDAQPTKQAFLEILLK